MILVTGDFNIDHVFELLGTEVLGKQEARSYLREPGGKALNQAVTASRLGCPVRVMGCVGQDQAGEEILAYLNREGIGTQGLQTSSQSSTGAMVYICSQGSSSETWYRGANEEFSREGIKEQLERLENIRVFVSTLTISINLLEDFLMSPALKRAWRLLDAGPANPDAERLFGLADCVRMNGHEAQVYTGVNIDSKASAFSAAHSLYNKYGRPVIIGASGSGNLLFESEQSHKWIPIETEPISTRGSGDAMVGAMLQP